jgi:glycosyltransferase involved in cell wall biosynthesis
MALRGLGLLMGDWMLRAMKPDIVHETYFSPYRLGSVQARRVLTIYDMIHEKFADSFPRADKTARFKALAARRADHVICISESTQRDAIEILGIPRDKTSVIYLGFDLMTDAAADREDMALPTHSPFLLYVGNRGGYKNFSRLLEAYGTSSQLNREYELVCFGGGAFQYDELEAMRAFGLNKDRVKQFGGNDHLLAELYRHASAFVYPSEYEGFGIPPLEAMSHDCPVICSNTSSIPEVVGDAGEYFDPVNTDSLRMAIERVLTQGRHRETLIRNGRARLDHFSWDRCALETLHVYNQLV